MTDRLCVFCEHWWFDGGLPWDGGETQGDPPVLHCEKGHYDYEQNSSVYEMTTEKFRRTILKARDCPDYQPPKEAGNVTEQR